MSPGRILDSIRGVRARCATRNCLFIPLLRPITAEAGHFLDRPVVLAIEDRNQRVGNTRTFCEFRRANGETARQGGALGRQTGMTDAKLRVSRLSRRKNQTDSNDSPEFPMGTLKPCEPAADSYLSRDRSGSDSCGVPYACAWDWIRKASPCLEPTVSHPGAPDDPFVCSYRLSNLEADTGSQSYSPRVKKKGRDRSRSLPAIGLQVSR